MAITVLVIWEEDSEIDFAIEIRDKIHELLDLCEWHSGMSMVNIPPKSFGLHIKGESLKKAVNENE